MLTLNTPLMQRVCYRANCHVKVNANQSATGYIPFKVWGVPKSPTKARCRRPALSFAVADPSQLIADLADLDPATAGTIAAVLKPTLSIGSLLMIVRIVMTWYPDVDATKFPWSIAYTPTEPVLSATRKIVKPFNGLDVSPIVWFAILSFLSEILTGPQGILSLLQRKGLGL
jgi:YggT family protein